MIIPTDTPEAVLQEHSVKVVNTSSSNDYSNTAANVSARTLTRIYNWFIDTAVSIADAHVNTLFDTYSKGPAVGLTSSITTSTGAVKFA
jgi:hypothetical protein